MTRSAAIARICELSKDMTRGSDSNPIHSLEFTKRSSFFHASKVKLDFFDDLISISQDDQKVRDVSYSDSVMLRFDKSGHAISSEYPAVLFLRLKKSDEKGFERYSTTSLPGIISEGELYEIFQWLRDKIIAAGGRA